MHAIFTQFSCCEATGNVTLLIVFILFIFFIFSSYEEPALLFSSGNFWLQKTNKLILLHGGGNPS